MSRRKFVGVMALSALVVLGALLSPMLAAYAQPSRGTHAQHFIDIANRASDRVDELIDIADSLNITLPEYILTNYTVAEELLQAAIDSQENEEFEDAIESAKEAMRRFRQLYADIFTILQESGADLEEDDEGQGIRVALERALERLNRVEEIINRSEEAGMNVTVARGFLEDARALLDEIQDLIENGDLDDAAEMLGEANSLIAHALASTKGAAGRFNKMRIRGFSNGMHGRLNGLERRLDAAERQGLNVTALRDMLDDVRSLLEEAIQLAEEDNLDEAIEKLEMAKELMEDIDDQLKSLRRGNRGNGRGPP